MVFKPGLGRTSRNCQCVFILNRPPLGRLANEASAFPKGDIYIYIYIYTYTYFCWTLLWMVATFVRTTKRIQGNPLFVCRIITGFFWFVRTGCRSHPQGMATKSRLICSWDAWCPARKCGRRYHPPNLPMFHASPKPQIFGERVSRFLSVYSVGVTSWRAREPLAYPPQSPATFAKMLKSSLPDSANEAYDF